MGKAKLQQEPAPSWSYVWGRGQERLKSSLGDSEGRSLDVAPWQRCVHPVPGAPLLGAVWSLL